MQYEEMLKLSTKLQTERQSHLCLAAAQESKISNHQICYFKKIKKVKVTENINKETKCIYLRRSRKGT